MVAVGLLIALVDRMGAEPPARLLHPTQLSDSVSQRLRYHSQQMMQTMMNRRHECQTFRKCDLQ